MGMTAADRAIQAIRDRAIVIYRWRLAHPEAHPAQSVPGYAKDKQEQRAYEMLVDRGLIRRVNYERNTPQWRIARVCNAADCLELSAIVNPAFRGLVSYRVPPAVARDSGASPQLQEYAIGAIKQW